MERESVQTVAYPFIQTGDLLSACTWFVKKQGELNYVSHDLTNCNDIQVLRNRKKSATYFTPLLQTTNSLLPQDATSPDLSPAPPAQQPPSGAVAGISSITL